MLLTMQYLHYSTYNTVLTRLITPEVYNIYIKMYIVFCFALHVDTIFTDMLWCMPAMAN